MGWEKNLSQGLKALGAATKVASWAGVPFVSMVGDVAFMGSKFLDKMAEKEDAKAEKEELENRFKRMILNGTK